MRSCLSTIAVDLMTVTTLLLPARVQLPGTIGQAVVARALGCADVQRGAAGIWAQLDRHFSRRPLGEQWPVALLTRQLDVGDHQATVTWLRADPASIEPDQLGARLVAYGEQLALTEEDCIQLTPALQAFFAEQQLPFDTPHPSRWYLQFPKDTPLPLFTPPQSALGSDIFDALPPGVTGQRFRALLSDTQILLHQHPWNQQRQARGLPPVNALWFWGPGQAPLSVTSNHRQIRSRDPLICALSQAARQSAVSMAVVDALVDLRHLRTATQLSQGALAPLLAAMQQKQLQQLTLDFQDGVLMHLKPRHRLRIWRRACTHVCP